MRPINLITSQLPVDAWHEVIGETQHSQMPYSTARPQRLPHGLDGQSMRKPKSIGDENTNTTEYHKPYASKQRVTGGRNSPVRVGGCCPNGGGRIRPECAVLRSSYGTQGALGVLRGRKREFERVFWRKPTIQKSLGEHQ